MMIWASVVMCLVFVLLAVAFIRFAGKANQPQHVQVTGCIRLSAWGVWEYGGTRHNIYLNSIDGKSYWIKCGTGAATTVLQLCNDGDVITVSGWSFKPGKIRWRVPGTSEEFVMTEDLDSSDFVLYVEQVRLPDELLRSKIDDLLGWPRRAEIAAAAFGGNDIAVRHLIGLLADPVKGDEAARVLGMLKEKSAVDALLKEAAARSRSAILALGEIGDPRATEPLSEMLRRSRKDDFPWASCLADALGKIGDSRAVDCLIEALRDANLNTSASAAVALGRIGDQRALGPLVSALRRDPSRPSWMQSELPNAAAKGLGYLKKFDSVPYLVEALHRRSEYNDYVSETVQDSLRKITGERYTTPVEWEEWWVQKCSTAGEQPGHQRHPAETGPCTLDTEH